MTHTENMSYFSAKNALITDMLILDIQYLRPWFTAGDNIFKGNGIMMFRNGILFYIQFENKYNVANDCQQLTEMNYLYATCCSCINHKRWQGKHL